MKDKALEILKHIPEYPDWGSVVHIAYKSGYLVKPFTDKRVKEGLKAFEKDLTTLTLKHSEIYIQETDFKTQKKTLSLLQSIGIEYKEPSMRYLSIVEEVREGE